MILDAVTLCPSPQWATLIAGIDERRPSPGV